MSIFPACEYQTSRGRKRTAVEQRVILRSLPLPYHPPLDRIKRLQHTAHTRLSRLRGLVRETRQHFTQQGLPVLVGEQYVGVDLGHTQSPLDVRDVGAR